MCADEVAKYNCNRLQLARTQRLIALWIINEYWIGSAVTALTLVVIIPADLVALKRKAIFETKHNSGVIEVSLAWAKQQTILKW